MKNCSVGMLKVEDILVGERFREDFGDLSDLVADIQENGIIQSLAVLDTGGGQYLLLAGERRLRAAIEAKLLEVPCRIYTEALSPLEMRSIELSENIYRKAMSWQEEINLKQEIHNLQVGVHGRAIKSSKEGWSVKDTADMLGKSRESVQKDLNLAEVVTQLPDAFAGCKSKSDAEKVLRQIKEQTIREALAMKLVDEGEAAQAGLPTYKSLADKYIVGDFNLAARNQREGTFNLIELDPPYGIDLREQKASRDTNLALQSYEEIPAKEYEAWLAETLMNCYRLAANGSWIIVWFGWSWYEKVFNLIQATGFECHPVPAVWVKPNGQTIRPDLYLARTCEPFFYARKGGATIVRQGRIDNFSYTGAGQSARIHPTEKPIELMIDIYSTFCERGARVCIPCLGSGVGLKAAAQLGMSAIGWDKSQVYKDGFLSTLL